MQDDHLLLGVQGKPAKAAHFRRAGASRPTRVPAGHSTAQWALGPEFRPHEGSTDFSAQ